MDYSKHIVINPLVRGGKPCIRGTRITVYDVFDYLAGGTTVDDLLAQFPDLSREALHACYAYAAERDKRLMTVTHEAAA